MRQMSIRRSKFLKRIPQTIVSVALVLILFERYPVIADWPFKIFLLLVMCGALVELSALFHNSYSSIQQKRRFTACICIIGLSVPVAVLAAQQFAHVSLSLNGSGYYVLGLCLVILRVVLRYIGIVTTRIKHKHTAHNRRALWGVCVAFFYIGIPSAILLLFSAQHRALSVMRYAVFAIALFDVACYCFGTVFGKHSKKPFLISPHKSVAGYVGGFTTTVVVIALFLYLNTALFMESIFKIPILIVITIFFAAVGDLFESALKRSARIKDSGGLVRGRGGILDSIDSHLLAAPIFCVLYTILY